MPIDVCESCQSKCHKHCRQSLPWCLWRVQIESPSIAVFGQSLGGYVDEMHGLELVVLVISKAVASYAELNSVLGIAPPRMEASATRTPRHSEQH